MTLRPFAVVAAVLLSLGGAVGQVPAQVSERPVPFDSAGQVTSITPPLAARLALAPPAWPVSGAFVEARLYDLGNTRFVLVVQRAGGVVDRYEISAEGRESLQRAVAAGLATTGTLVVRDRQDAEFESASSAFVRNQTVLGALVYGPAAAALVDGGAGAGALYFATAGATFFTSLAISRSHTVTKAQNRLATDGGWRGALIGLGTKYAISGEDDEGSANAAVILAGGILGSAFGFNAGRPFTNSEATAATFGSTFAVLTAAGIIASFGGFEQSETIAEGGVSIEEDDENRAEVAGLVVAALAGYPLGLAYARRASYGVTAGDVGPLFAGGVIGALGASALVGEDSDDQAGAAVVTAGFLFGTLVTDRALVKPYDLTEGEGRLMGLGALAGGLAAMAIPTLAESDDGRVYAALGALGGAVGMMITRSLLKPERAGRQSDTGGGVGYQVPESDHRAARRPRVTFTLHSQNAATLLLPRPRSHGVVPLATLSF